MNAEKFRDVSRRKPHVTFTYDRQKAAAQKAHRINRIGFEEMQKVSWARAAYTDAVMNGCSSAEARFQAWEDALREYNRVMTEAFPLTTEVVEVSA